MNNPEPPCPACQPGHWVPASSVKTSPARRFCPGIQLTRGSDAAGLHIVSIWESQAQAKRFEAEKLFPAFQAAGTMPERHSTTFTVFDADEVYIRR